MPEPRQIMRDAMKGHVKAIALRLGRSEDWVYKMMADASCCTYTRFLAAFIPIFEENPLGAEEVFEDFRARMQLLRESSVKTKNVHWTDAVAKTVEESAQAIKAAVEDRDPARIEKEITEAISSYRALLKIVVRKDREPIQLAAAGGQR